MFGLTLTRLIDRLRRKDSSPLPAVRAINDGGMFLEVTNRGADGKFEARVELLQGLDKVHHDRIPVDFHGYAGFWERGHGPTSSLAQGQTDRLIIGRVESAPSNLPPAALYKMGFCAADRAYAEYVTTGWIDGISGIVPPRLVLRVVIDSIPSTRKGPYVNTFVIDQDDPQPLRDEKPFTTRYTGVTIRHY